MEVSFIANTKKRIFIGLISLSLFLIGITLLVAYYLVVNDASTLHKVLLIIVGGFLLVMLILLGVGVLGLVFNLIRQKPLPFLQKIMLMATNALFPVALYLGKILGVDKETIKRSFIAVNNQLVKNQEVKLDPQEVMILAPHCLQWSECPHKITIDSKNCKRCGKCVVDDLHSLTEKYGVSFVVASGGTLARKFIKEFKPRAVVAIACERDLCSGIQDTPLPVLGVLNIRPQGPCFNTCVNLEAVEEATKFFLQINNLKK
ncbi:MAG: uncharacterized protein PWQ96_1512 [Clostridia bacterium]|nr:hypothetical protein [Clostridiales bacterium]MDK2985870.1 uncharacterized protein [Clostridia bacterium]